MAEPDGSRGSTLFAGTGTAGLAIPNRGEPELVVLVDPEAVAHEAAQRIAAALIAAVELRGRADFCTTGGSTPIPIYRLLAQSPLRDRIPWQQVHVWWGDERFVPRDHPDSNVTAVDDVLLGGSSDASGGIPLPAANIHPFPTDRAIAEMRDNAWCAAQYAEEMAAQLPLGESHWPVFDLVIVGVGTDGHVLSCFPDSPALESLAWTMGIPAPSHIGPHLPRMTVNPRILDAAPVLVVSWGAGKAEALGHVFGDVRDDHRWPVQRTRRPGAVWLVDEAAASQVPEERR
ncbi:MAG: 6-phosphogluconolactonase [Candidatus Limnocylindrales bacterium]